MASPRHRAHRPVVVVLVALLSGLGLQLGAGPAAAAPVDLVGTLRITAGSCAGGASGSYFRMILPTGTTRGPWVENGDSACADKTYTLLTPGTEGGLTTGTHQPAPSPGFDGNGNSLAVKVIRPVRFFGVDFSASTNPTDLQTGATVAPPSLQADGGRLAGDFSAFAATWNKQAFNQGAPKPGGATPGNTARPSGTYDAATGAFSVTWTSTIVGGPFDKFTGLWHLEGTFVPAGGAPADGGGSATTAPAASAGGGSAPDATVPADEAAAPDAAPEATVPEVAAPSSPAVAPASAVRVDDESFQAPVWLVVLLGGRSGAAPSGSGRSQLVAGSTPDGT